MISDINVDWYNLTKADMYTIIRQTEEQNDKLRKLASKIYSGYMGGHYVVSCKGCKYAYEDYGDYEPLNPYYCLFDDNDEYIGCWKRKKIEDELRELGVKIN